MSIISEKIEGTIINVIINSSNIKNAVYDTETKDLTITFNNNSLYMYQDVPWELFTKFRMSESQGKFFSQNISRNFKYKKI
jgi:hypothetical protein